VQKTLYIGGPEESVQICGPRDTNLKRLRQEFDVEMVARNGNLRIEGAEEDVHRCEAALTDMRRTVERGEVIESHDMDRILDRHRSGEAAQGRDGGPTGDSQPWPGVRPRTAGQARYVNAMLENDVVFCIGPAGTGKTFLGVALALNFLKRGRINRIVLCRPAVEAGESLGFLPGDIYAKVNPYLRPLYDALHDLMDVRRVKRYIENDIIEILPLAFVRGRTLDNAFIILDEAQNCTVSQMKTFLTRLGPRARLLVTGDTSQNDLPPSARSGLADARERLGDVPGIEFVRLNKSDIVRHPLVGRIITAYERELPPPAHRDAEGPVADDGMPGQDPSAGAQQEDDDAT
jgi:phosphate starvation-inducible PhoH-like protein